MKKKPLVLALLTGILIVGGIVTSGIIAHVLHFREDLNGDGKNAYDYEKRIEVLNWLTYHYQEPFLYCELASASEKLSDYYEGEHLASTYIRTAAWAMEQAISIYGQHLGWSYELAGYYIQLGELDKAIEEMVAVANSAESFPYKIELANLYRLNGEYEKGIAVFDGLLTNDASYLYQYYYCLGQLYEDSRDIDNAARHYRIALEKFPDNEQIREGLPLIRKGTSYFRPEGEKKYRVMTEADYLKQKKDLRALYQQAYDRVSAKTGKAKDDK